MIGIVLIALQVSAVPTRVPEKAPFCRGVLLKDEQGTFLLITLKVAGDATSRIKVRQAAEPLGGYSYETKDEGRTILNVGFVNNGKAEEVVSFWKNVRTGLYGAVSVEPFTFPGSWIGPDDPCFGSSVGR